MWEAEITDQFGEWWATLDELQQYAITNRVTLLEEHGPDLGRPVVDRVKRSRHQHMKELRASKGGVLRVPFMFDPRRQIILLIGGDKTGKWNSWYRRMIPIADDLYDAYLEELRQEGLL